MYCTAENQFFKQNSFLLATYLPHESTKSALFPRLWRGTVLEIFAGTVGRQRKQPIIGTE